MAQKCKACFWLCLRLLGNEAIGVCFTCLGSGVNAYASIYCSSIVYYCLFIYLLPIVCCLSPMPLSSKIALHFCTVLHLPTRQLQSSYGQWNISEICFMSEISPNSCTKLSELRTRGHRFRMRGGGFNRDPRATFWKLEGMDRWCFKSGLDFRSSTPTFCICFCWKRHLQFLVFNPSLWSAIWNLFMWPFGLINEFRSIYINGTT